ncbi:hypothetical protein ALC57_10675 [Trachymyrmex cornetzi]|uniref:DNA-directed DNA polymerase n=1 Tax=Trachymyrmex cornetzi TaxID=471704 RepID=A0A151J3M7_9HYME|nr:hypothetical protein ALC57_10675 [Trachymyrmex cornetzi]
MSTRCCWCGVREFVFRHDPVKEFVDFATRTSKYFNKIICIAHNAKAFDAQFILKYIVEQSGIIQEPRIILNGTKIIMMTVGNTKFIDSSNYMPMRLSDLPKAFGLQDTSGKGIFPHLFNRKEHQAYRWIVNWKDKRKLLVQRGGFSSSVHMTMTETMLRRMFAFFRCIDVTFERLVRLVDTVDVKYTRFSNIASEDAIRDSYVFNKYQLVDCELLASVFNIQEEKSDVIICE